MMFMNKKFDIPGRKVIVALDYSTVYEAIEMARQLDPMLCILKVGSELFTAVGPKIIERLRRLGHEVFLDLKYHDIPNTVWRACSVAESIGVWGITVHILGGEDCVRGSSSGKWNSQIFGITILTSMTQQRMREIGFEYSIPELVERLSLIGLRGGLSGVVCSGHEIEIVRGACGDNFKIITPGMRIPDDIVNDQGRVMTPEEAFQKGANYIVVGRPIIDSTNPAKALERYSYGT